MTGKVWTTQEDARHGQALPPRTFTPHQVATLTTGEYSSLSPADRAAFERAYWAAISEPSIELSHYLSGDYDLIASNRRFELGE